MARLSFVDHPTWDRRTRTLARVLRRAARAVTGHRSAKRTRKQVERIAFLSPARRDVTIDQDNLGALTAHWFAHQDRKQNSNIILYLHGGGFAIGSTMGTHRRLISDLAVYSGLTCVAPTYRLAPDHMFPAAIEDAVVAYRALLERGYLGSQIIVAGDSAGGNLSLGLVQEIRRLSLAMPRAMVLLSPWVDLTCSAASIDRNGGFDYLSRTMLENFSKIYVGSAEVTSALVSPRFADFAGFPPMLVHAGSAEILVDEIEDMVGRATKDAVQVQYQAWPGMMHVWHGFSFVLPQAEEAMQAVGKFCREQLALPESMRPRVFETEGIDLDLVDVA